MSSASVSGEYFPIRNPLSTIPCNQIRENGLCLNLMSDPPGVVEIPGYRSTIISIHIGPSVYTSCHRGGQSHHGTTVHGDIDIIPPGTPGRWEIKEKDTAFVLSLSPDFMKAVIEQFEIDPRHVEIRNRFQERDTQLENLAWALKAEQECGYPCGRLYFDSLAVAVAARVVRCHSSFALEPSRQNGRMADRRLRQVLSFIEDHLSHDISLSEIAAVAGVSVSHFKTLFRESMGSPVHQYVIRRRLERARMLLAEGKLSISQIAFETGFAHQSHLARHMRRVLGVSPKALREMLV